MILKGQVGSMQWLDCSRMVDDDFDSDNAFRTQYLCEGCSAVKRSRELASAEYYLPKRPTRGWVNTGLAEVVLRSVVDIIQPRIQGLITTDVVWGAKRTPAHEYCAIWCQDKDMLRSQRGRYAVSKQCKMCRCVYTNNGWSYPVVLERDISPGRFYMTDYWMLMAYKCEEEVARIAAMVKSRRIFDVPVVTESLSGEVLPGDPGWSGALKRRRIPTPPTDKPVPGTKMHL